MKGSITGFRYSLVVYDDTKRRRHARPAQVEYMVSVTGAVPQIYTSKLTETEADSEKDIYNLRVVPKQLRAVRHVGVAGYLHENKALELDQLQPDGQSG